MKNKRLQFLHLYFKGGNIIKEKNNKSSLPNEDILHNKELEESRRQLINKINGKRKSALPWKPTIYLEF